MGGVWLVYLSTEVVRGGQVKEMEGRGGNQKHGR